jgi:hypothetical protein
VVVVAGGHTVALGRVPELLARTGQADFEAAFVQLAFPVALASPAVLAMPAEAR